MDFARVPCPICKIYRTVNFEEYQLILRSQQFMCWDVCGHDVFAPGMWFFLNKIRLDDD
jgi:hypothetical protein